MIMKLRVVWLLSLLVFGMASLWAQEVPGEVLKAWNKGDAQAIASFLGKRVVLVVNHQSAALDKAVVEERLSRFFENNRVYGFTATHRDKRKDSCFVIGTLATKGGLYRVNCFFRREGEKYIIHQIRIDRTNNE